MKPTKPVELNEFIGKLAHQLIFNDFLQVGPTMRCREAISGAQEVSFALTQTQTQHFGRLPLGFFFFCLIWVLGTVSHLLLKIMSHPRYKDSKSYVQLRCKRCGDKCSYYCGKCSSKSADSLHALCNSGGPKTCFATHIENFVS